MIASTMPATVFAGRLDYEPEEQEPAQIAETEEEKPSTPVEKETEPEAKETEAPKETEPAEKEPEAEAPQEAEEPEATAPEEKETEDAEAPEAKENDAEAEKSAEQEPERPVTVKAKNAADFDMKLIKFSNGILSWNAVDGAVRYSIGLVKGGDIETTACSYDLGKYIDKLIENREIYKDEYFTVFLRAYDADDFRVGMAEVEIHYKTSAEPATKLPEITNLKISADGILTWDEYKNDGNDFSGYDIRVIGEGSLEDHIYLPGHSFDLKKFLNEYISYGFKEFPTYKIQVVATESVTWKPIAESGYVTYNYKKANTMTVKVKKSPKFKASKLKKKSQSIKRSNYLTIKKNKGKVSYAKTAGNSNIKVNAKTGNITVKKKTKKGTYTIQIKVKAAGNSAYSAVERTLTVKVKVKK